MAESMNTLKELLLNDPFNIKIREKYAQELFNEGMFDDSLAQWEILQQNESSNVRYLDTINKIRSQIRSEAPDIMEKNDVNGGNITLLNNKESGGKVAQPSTGSVANISRSNSVRFVDIAGMSDLKKMIRRRIIDPFINPSLFQKFKRKAGGGVLLYGPPGCGKTMMARAIATECKASFHSVGIGEVLNMFIGESESNLANIFDRARASKPSVIFFDELDALAYSRSKASSDHTRTLVNEFLSQLDGVSGDNNEMLVLGATNMPWDVDDAMKRPGRFDRQIFVPPPDVDALADMLKIKLRDVPCDEISEMKVARLCNLFSGADMDGLIEHAKDQVLDDIIDTGNERNINESDLLGAIENVIPSTTDWMKTARNLVKYGNAGAAYKDVDKYLRSIKSY